MHREAKQYRNLGVWIRERFIAGPAIQGDRWLMP